MVYIPREILRMVLGQRRCMMFHDRIKRLEGKIHLPFELDLIEQRHNIEIWKSRVRVGFYEISRMAIYSAPLHSPPEETIRDFQIATFYMYKWFSPISRINVGYQSVSLSWNDEGYATTETTTSRSIIYPADFYAQDDSEWDYE